MNRVFSIVWSRVHGAWRVAGEHASHRGRPGTFTRRRVAPVSACAMPGTESAIRLSALTTILCASLWVSPPVLGQALPTAGQVVAGSGTIGAASGGKLTIDQASQRMAIDWQQFNIGAGNTVQFRQPGANAVALNRVLGSDGSQIMGQLQANGRVFLVNPNGILFGPNAQVDVGGLVASTLGISNADFMAGRYRFQGNGSPGAVINQGRISAAEGGAVALLGGQVHNQGLIQARMGTVALAAGNAVTLDFAGDGLLNVQVDQAAKNVLVENGQLIQADGGQVLLTASASDALLQTVVNNTGIIEARTLESREGKIVLLGDFAGGAVKVDGKLDASAPNGGDGGFIDTSGAYVQVADGVKVTTLAPQGKTGTWLIDPTDFTVTDGAGGGLPPDHSSIGAQTLSNLLDVDSDGGTNVQIATVPAVGGDGDIHVNAPVSWSADNSTLTLVAHRNININADITATGTASGLKMHYGGHPGPDSPAPETGYFLNHGAKVTLSGDDAIFKVNHVDYTVIQNVAQLQDMSLNLAGSYVLGQDIDAGATQGWNDAQGFVPVGNSVSQFSGVLDGLGHTVNQLSIDRADLSGVGLFGFAQDASIRNVGLVNVAITGQDSTGALVGSADGGLIGRSYATGTVSGDTDVGGLVGRNAAGTIEASYASASVQGEEAVGGLVGRNSGQISNSYAIGSVNGTRMAGGLVGENDSGSISYSYSTGAVIGDENLGGLVGSNVSGGTVTQSYWDKETSGQEESSGGLGYVTSDLQEALPDGFHPDVWGIVPEVSYPYLLNQFAKGATPQVLAGMVDGGCSCDPAGAGIAVDGWQDGQKLVSAQTAGGVHTGANGYYYYLLAPGSLAPDSPLFVSATNESGFQAATYVDSPESQIDYGEVYLFGDLFDVQSTSPSWTSLVALLDNTTGTSGASARDMALLLPDLDLRTTGDFELDTALDKTGAIYVWSEGVLSVKKNLSSGGDIVLFAADEVIVDGALTVSGSGAGLGVIGSSVTLNADISIEGGDNDMVLMACDSCGGGDIAINGDVSITGNGASLLMQAGGEVSVDGNIAVTGNDAAVAMLGQSISTSENSSFLINGERNAIAMVACGEADCSLTSEEIPSEDFDSPLFDEMEGSISIKGDIAVVGDYGSIAMIGGDVSSDADVSINGNNGAIALVACQESGCGDVLVNGDVSITGDSANIVALASDGIWTAGDISVNGSGLIALSAGSLTLDGAVSITGSGDIVLQTCASCDPALGDIAINGDISVQGGNNALIVVDADGDLFLNATVLAQGGVDPSVQMAANGDIVGTEHAHILASSLNLYAEGAIELSDGVHYVDELTASSLGDLKFANGQALWIDEAAVWGDGDILIRTTAGELALLPPFDPMVSDAAVSVAGKGDIDLVSAAAFINERGAAAVDANDGNWRIWSQAPAQTELNGLSYDFKQYNAHYGSSTVLGQGNGVLYTLAPVLEVGLNGTVAKTYDGNDMATLTSSNYVLKGGVQAGDQAVFSTPAQGRYGDRTAGVNKTVTVDGVQVVNAFETVGGAAVYGYRIGPVSDDIGRIDKRAISVSALDQDKVYGNADPALGYTVGGQGLVAGDSLGGSLARAGGENVGSYAIGLGSLGNANYQIIEFSTAALNITPRSIIVAANDQSKYLGQADPALTWRIIEGSLAFDDRLGGALRRDPGQSPGTYAIRRGSLAANNNYVLDFVDGKLVVLLSTIDDELGDLAPAYQAALVSAQNVQQGLVAFDQYTVDDVETEHGVQAVDTPLPYQVENDGLRMPEGI